MKNTTTSMAICYAIIFSVFTFSAKSLDLTCGHISALKIYDQSTDDEVPGIGAITNGTVINIADLPANYYLTIETSGTIESVVLSLNSDVVTENEEPYTYPGGANSGNNWNGGVGSYTLMADAYFGNNGSGNLCDKETFNFDIVNGVQLPTAPTCSGGSFLWENNIITQNGIPPFTVRFIDGQTTSYTIPGPYPPEFSGPVFINVSEAVSWDGYVGRTNTGNQPNEQWKVVFRQGGNTIYETGYSGDLATGLESDEWLGSLGSQQFFPDGVDEILLVHYEDITYGTGSSSSANSVSPSSVCFEYETCNLSISGTTTSNEECVAVPVNPNCGCNGNVASITAIFNGNSGSSVTVYNDDETVVLGSFTNVSNGQILYVEAGNYNNGEFDNKTFWQTNNHPLEEIHTSCSQDIAGMTFGDFTVIAFTDSQGGVCNPVSCNGSADITVSGGTGPYNYSWSNGSTDEDPTGLCEGDYTVTVTDANGCTIDATFNVVFQSNPITATAVFTEPDPCEPEILPTCNCACDGKMTNITVVYNGPSGANINVWNKDDHSILITSFSNVQNGQTLFVDPTGILPGDDFESKTFFEVINGNETEIHTSCSQDIAGLTIGDFTVIGYTDGAGQICDATNCIGICECDGGIADITLLYEGPSGVNAGAYNGNTVIILWNNLQTGQFVNVNSAMIGQDDLPNVDILVDGINLGEIHTSCSQDIQGMMIGDFTVVSFIDKNGNECNALDCNGAIDLTVSGVGPFTYSWSTGETTQDLTDVCAGTYVVTITDGNSCSETFTFVLDCTPCTLEVDAGPDQDLCPPETVTLSASVSGESSCPGPCSTANNSYSINLDEWEFITNGLICGDEFTSTTDGGAYTDLATFFDPIGNSNEDIVSITVTFNVAACDLEESTSISNTDQVAYAYPIELNGYQIGTFDPLEYPCIFDECEEEPNRTQTYTIDPTQLTYNYNGMNTLDLNFDNSGHHICVANIDLEFNTEEEICDPSNSDVNYLWSNGATSSSIIVGNPGTYTVTVTDCNGCIATDEVDVSLFCDDFDLALIKTLTSPGPFAPGDDVTFTISVINQGPVEATTVTLKDYIPTGMSLNDPNWNPDGTKVIGPIPSGSTVNVDITLNIDANFNGTSLENIAEISNATNPFGAPDVDSTPNDDPNDDTVGGNDITDNTNGDEDDHDPEEIPVEQVVSLGSTVFADNNNNGSQDLGEGGIEGVVVQLWSTGADGVKGGGDDVNVSTQTTSENGEFWFIGLDPGTYYAKINSPDEDYPTSSTDGPDTANPDSNTDGDDNGIQTGGSGEMVMSNIITLTPGNEPTTATGESAPGADQDDADDDNGNMTLDFGFVPKFDLALTKTLSSAGPFMQGDLVTFTITVINQGAADASSVTLKDYVPAGMTLADGDWNPDGTYDFGPLAAGTSGSVDITLMINTNFNGSSLENIAEISNATNPAGSNDVDSTPNDDPNDDTIGGNDVTDNTNGDEDDHDPEEISVGQTVSLGSTVFRDNNNNGNQDPGEGGIEGVVVDLWSVGPNGVKGGGDDVLVSTQTTDADGEYWFEDLIPGAYYVKINTPDEDYPTSSADGPDTAIPDNNTDGDDNGIQVGGSGTMVMSNVITLTPGDEPTTATGESAPGADQDDADDDNGNMTLDFGFVPVFDLALIKTLSSSGPFMQGDDVTFTITVINQGVADATSITLQDYVPAGMSLNDPAWNADGTYNFGPLAAGTSGSVNITLMINTNFNGNSLENIAEISEATNSAVSDDVDSTPNDDPNDDVVGGNDVTDNSNGDEDDHDPETIPVGQTVSLGSTVFADNNNNGTQDPGEGGIGGVVVDLWSVGPDGEKGGGDDVMEGTQTTDESGLYWFTGLEPGEYYVKINTPDSDYPTSSTDGPDTANPDSNTDGDDNGIQMGGSGTMVMSNVITLTPGDEPTTATGESAPGANQDDLDDDNGNMTLDFGFVPKFDLALIKTLSSSGPFVPGDLVTFTITVINQGAANASSVTLKDYVPSGMTLADGDWNPDGTYDFGPLAAVTSGAVDITLMINTNFNGSTLENIAEISNTTNPAGSDDVDSTPNDDPNDDTIGGNDVTDNTNGDEDDHDPEEIDVCQDEVMCPSNITVNNDPGLCSAIVTFPPPIAEPNCLGLSVIQTTGLPSGSVFPVGTTLISFQLIDPAGNITTCNFNVIVIDNEDPICLTQDVTIMLDENNMAFITVNDINNGSSDNCGISSFSVNPSTFDCDDLGVNTVTLTVTDVNGNSSTCTAEVTVEQDGGGSLTCMTQNITVTLTDDQGVTVSPGSIDISNNCGDPMMFLDQDFFDCDDVGVNTVNLTITLNNETVSCPAEVTIVDPSFVECSATDITVSLDENGQAFVNPSFILDLSTSICGSEDIQLDKTSFDCADIGVNPVSIVITDTDGNITSCTSNITVVDDSSPLCMPMASTIVYLDENGVGTVDLPSLNMAATDNCGMVFYSNNDVFTCNDVGFPIMSSFTATDLYGNSKVCPVDVFVVDTFDPICTANNVSVNISSGTPTIDMTQALLVQSFDDNCDDAFFTFSPKFLDCDDIGTNTVVVTVIDNSGNSSTCNAQVSVTDTEDPVCNFVNQTVELEPGGQVIIIPSEIGMNSTDNCQIASYNLDKIFFDCDDVGVHIVELTVTDQSGNSASCSGEITIEDNLPAGGTCKNVIASLNNNEVTVPLSVLFNSQNCSQDFSLSVNGNSSSLSFFCEDVGNNPVTLEVNTTSGTTTCVSNVIVQDNVLPTFSVPCQDVTVNTNGCAEVYVNVPSPSVIDNCLESLTNDYNNSGDASDTYPIGTTTVTWTAIDAGANIISCVSNITVIGDPSGDTTPPVINGLPQSSYNLSYDGTTCGAYVDLPEPTAQDECGADLTWATIFTSKYPGQPGSGSYPLGTNITSDIGTGIGTADGNYPVGTTQVTWSAVDQAGNLTQASVDVIVSNIPAPTPLGVTCINNGNTVRFEWSSVTGAAGYRLILRAKPAAGSSISGQKVFTQLNPAFLGRSKPQSDFSPLGVFQYRIITGCLKAPGLPAGQLSSYNYASSSWVDFTNPCAAPIVDDGNSDNYVDSFDNIDEEFLNDFESLISIYPNPTEGELIIESNTIINKIEVIDLLGKVHKNLQELPEKFVLDLSFLERNVYILRIESEGKVYVERIVLQ